MKYPGFKKRAVFCSLDDLISFCRLMYWNPTFLFKLDSDTVFSILSKGPREALFFVNCGSKYEVKLVIRYNVDCSFTLYDNLV